MNVLLIQTGINVLQSQRDNSTVPAVLAAGVVRTHGSKCRRHDSKVRTGLRWPTAELVELGNEVAKQRQVEGWDASPSFVFTNKIGSRRATAGV